MDPARMFKESLTSRPELENSQGQKQTLQRVRGRSVHSRIVLQNSVEANRGP